MTFEEWMDQEITLPGHMTIGGKKIVQRWQCFGRDPIALMRQGWDAAVANGGTASVKPVEQEDHVE